MKTQCIAVLGAVLASGIVVKQGAVDTRPTRFVDHADGTVTDSLTGLMWQQIPPGTGPRAPALFDWEGAVRFCEDLSLGGRTDWRLPSVHELQTLVDYLLCGPAIDPVFAGAIGEFWTSTSLAGEPLFAWTLDFRTGSTSVDYKRPDETCYLRLRAVRGGKH